MQNGPIEIPNKSSFKINEVCALTGVKSYVLRFWESEFPEIAPIMSSSGVKLYEHRDIEAILLIKKLLFEEKYTIEKVKACLHSALPTKPMVDEAFNEDIVELYPNELHLRESNTQRVLIDSEFQKLIIAKSKISDLLSRLELIEKRHHWS
jgi:DNA-binding transcriptional MerR regulator